MTHIKVDIQLPLRFNPDEVEKVGKEIPDELFFQTYEELLDLFGGISTSNVPIAGSWIHPTMKKRYDDDTRIFTVVVDSEDRKTISKVPKITNLILYKNKLKERFKQEEIFMIATRCTVL